MLSLVVLTEVQSPLEHQVEIFGNEEGCTGYRRLVGVEDYRDLTLALMFVSVHFCLVAVSAVACPHHDYTVVVPLKGGAVPGL